MKKNSRSHSAFIAITLAAFAFLYFLFFSRFDIMPADEGYFNLACVRIVNGEIPYRDFFLHTPPISYYVQAYIFKIFGEGFIVGRVTMSLAGVLITVLLFLITSRLAVLPFSIVPSVLFMFWGVSHIQYPFFNWYALLIAAALIPVVFKFTDSNGRIYLALAGFLIALLCFTKQNLGAAAGVSLFLYIFIMRWKKPGVVRDFAFMAGGSILAAFPVMLYFYKQNCLKDIIYYLFTYSGETLKARMELFPFPHLKIFSFFILGAYFLLGYAMYKAVVQKRHKAFIAMIIAGACAVTLFYKFASKEAALYINDHIKEGALNGFFNLPALCILAASYLLLRRVFKGEAIDKRGLRLLFLTIFCFFYIWFGLILARDMIHLIPTMAISYAFFGYFLNRLYDRYGARFTPHTALKAYYFVLPVLFFSCFGLFLNLNNETFKSSSTRLLEMNYTMDLERARFLVVEKERGSNLEALVKYIRAHTQPHEKIFVYHIDSSVYILADRLPGSFYTLFTPPDTFRKEAQERVIEDLARNKVRLVACDKGIYERWYGKDHTEKGGFTDLIEDYLHAGYRIKEDVGPYYILVKK